MLSVDASEAGAWSPSMIGVSLKPNRPGTARPGRGTVGDLDQVGTGGLADDPGGAQLARDRRLRDRRHRTDRLGDDPRLGFAPIGGSAPEGGPEGVRGTLGSGGSGTPGTCSRASRRSRASVRPDRRSPRPGPSPETAAAPTPLQARVGPGLPMIVPRMRARDSAALASRSVILTFVRVDARPAARGAAGTGAGVGTGASSGTGAGAGAALRQSSQSGCGSDPEEPAAAS